MSQKYWKERLQEIEGYANRVHAERTLEPLLDWRVKEMEKAWQKRLEAKDYYDGATNDIEIEQRKVVFIEAHKEYIRACGFRACHADDCMRINQRRSNAKYCSDACANRQRQRNHRLRKNV